MVDRVSGKPSKIFFVNMITRDVSLADCIMDLVDNAIDQVIETTKVDIMQMLTNGSSAVLFEGNSISLRLSPDEFLITDTCYGIGIEDAQKRVFRFGPGAEEVGDDSSGHFPGLSVYGIGMKRAFFKLGNIISVKSRTSTEWFQIDINAGNWLRQGDDDWDFKFTDQGTKATESAELPGTTISITELREGVKARFAQQSFIDDLRKKIAMTYALFIEAGFVMELNGDRIASAFPHLGTDAAITPARKILNYEEVEVLIIAGITAMDDKVQRGWYMFCNGRMIVEADKTELTGWGPPLPRWHHKYAHFVGYAYFKSNNLDKLPWTTTKRGIVFESPVYQAALSEMQVQSRPILTFLNNLYPGDVEPEGVAEREILQKTRNISITEVPRVESRFLVNIERARASREWANISYKRKRKDIDRIKSCSEKLRSASNKRIGEYTFDYYLKQECS